jgi:RimJ/RimL family protein N-acetyltransferase
MHLKLEKCEIRSWRSSDLESLVTYANNRNIWINLRDRFPHPYTTRDGHAFLKHTREQQPETAFAIVVNGEAAGGIGFQLQADVERVSAEIGYWLGEHYWRRGIVTEALELVSEHAFREFNVLRLFALPFADNIGSTRVLEKAGYLREGVLRFSSVKYGKARDQYMYSRINPDWHFE